MKMTYDDCLQMFNGLSQVKQPAFADVKELEEKDDYLFHVKFVHTVSYNKRKLKPIIEVLQDAEKFTDEYNEYVKKRDEFLAEHARKDKEGNPEERIIISDGIPRRSYNVPLLNVKNSKVWKEINKLEKEYKDEIEQQKKQQKTMEILLEEEANFESKKVPWSMIPKGLDALAMDGVMFMIEDEEVPDISKKEEREKPKK